MTAYKRPNEEIVWVPVGYRYAEGYTTAVSVSQGRTLHALKIRRYSGTVTPDFPHRKQYNRYSQQTDYVTPSNQSWDYQDVETPAYGGKTYIQNGFRDWITSVNSASLIGHIGQAELSASQRMASQMSGIKINLSQFYAERKQVINMIGSTARRLAHAALSLKKLRFGEVFSSLGINPWEPTKINKFRQRWVAQSKGLHGPQVPEQFLASAWLEFQYGWRPLLQDVYAAAEILADKVRNDRMLNMRKSSGTAKESYDESMSTFVYHGKGIVKKINYRGKTTCKYSVIFGIDNETTHALAVTGISNPALLAWELLPYSFVVDWFLPVGNYLEQMTAYDGVEFRSIYRTRFSRKSYDVSGLLDAGSGHNSLEDWRWVDRASGTWERILYERDEISRPASVPLAFKDPISPTHALNAIALLQTAFGKK